MNKKLLTALLALTPLSALPLLAQVSLPLSDLIRLNSQYNNGPVLLNNGEALFYNGEALLNNSEALLNNGEAPTGWVLRLCEPRGAAKQQLSPAENQANPSLLISFSSPSALDDMCKAGAEIISTIGTNSAIISAAPENIRAITACPGVTGARLSRLLKHANNKALPASGVDAVRNLSGFPSAVDGNGVIIGIYDTGMDPNHIAFKDADGTNRVKLLLHYPKDSASPILYDTPQKIADFNTDDREESHGTHVLGIMTGSFFDDSKPDQPDYRGVAPGAEIVAACGGGYTVQILDAIERMAQYAQEQGKPLVINLSFGDNVGPHDGSDEFTAAINDIAAKYDVPICLAVGNEGDEPIAIVKQLSENDSELKTMVTKTYNDAGVNFYAYGEIELWTNEDTPFEAYLDIINHSDPENPIYSFPIPTDKETYLTKGNLFQQFLDSNADLNIISGGTEFHNLFPNSFMGGIAGVDARNGKYCAKINLYLQGVNTATLNRNSVVIRAKGKPGQKIYLFTDGEYMGFGSRLYNMPGIDIPNGYGSNSNMAGGKETFAVGSYVTANIAGSGYPVGTVGEVSYFSSFGETLDGRPMPDLIAPGQVIVSARNTAMPTTSSFTYYYPLQYRYRNEDNGQTYYWTTCAGTSQASPHAAGVMALMLEVNPNLSRHDLYDILRQTASDSPNHSEAWGAGKLNAYEAVTKALSFSGIEEAQKQGKETIMLENIPGGYRVYAPGNEKVNISVFTPAGVLEKSFSADNEMTEISTASLPAGIHILNIAGNKSQKSFKVIKR